MLLEVNNLLTLYKIFMNGRSSGAKTSSSVEPNPNLVWETLNILPPNPDFLTPLQNGEIPDMSETSKISRKTF